MSNLVNFPVCQNIKGRHWYGGRAFKTEQEVIDSMSDRDWRRIVQWESRHEARIARQEEKRDEEWAIPLVANARHVRAPRKRSRWRCGVTLGPLARMSELSQIHGQRSLRTLRGCPIIYSASRCGCEGDLP